MARQGDAAHPPDLADHLLRGEAHVREVEPGQDVPIHPVHEDVAVVGLDLGRVEDQEPVLILQRPVIAVQVELAVLGQHDPIERPLLLLALEELQIRLDRRAAVVGGFGVQM